MYRTYQKINTDQKPNESYIIPVLIFLKPIIKVLLALFFLSLSMYKYHLTQINIQQEQKQWIQETKDREFLQFQGKKLKIKVDGSEYETGYQEPQVLSKFIQNSQKIYDNQPLIEIVQTEKIQSQIQQWEKQTDKQKLKIMMRQFYGKLHENPSDPFLTQFQYAYYDYKHNISAYTNQKRMCIISAGRNLLRNDFYIHFINSISRQNYTNYKLIIVDDASTDNTFTQLAKNIEKDLFLNTRTTLIRNPKNIGALANKDMSIRNHCGEGDVVIDVDADDALVGSQVFKLVNALYQQHDKWFIYSNYINYYSSYGSEVKQIRVGLSKEISEDHWRNYRSIRNYWVTSQLRTYLRDLYVKIPLQYFMQTPKYYHLWSSDRFIMYALVQLAGKDKTLVLFYYLYFYERTSNNRKTFCQETPIKYYQGKAKIQTPFAPLKSLSDDVKKQQNYDLPFFTMSRYFAAKRNYHRCKLAKEI